MSMQLVEDVSVEQQDQEDRLEKDELAQHHSARKPIWVEYQKGLLFQNWQRSLPWRKVVVMRDKKVWQTQVMAMLPSDLVADVSSLSVLPKALETLQA